MESKYVDDLIVSDIHLGSEVSRTKELLCVLEGYTFKRLILLGDIFDDMNFHRLRKQHWAVLSYIRKLSGEKRGVEVIWILGNHDTLLAQIASHLLGIEVYEEYTWERGGTTYLAIHGHQFDNFLVNNKILSDVASFLYFLIQKVDPAHQRISRFLKRMSKSWLRLSGKIAESAAHYAEKKKAHVVFCGHTHQAMQKKFGSISYYNTGCWTDIPSHFITIVGTEVFLHNV